jgi:hypothetical protein
MRTYSPDPEGQDPQPFDINDVPWYECLEILLKDFEPVEKPAEATHFWTTLEIAATIANHFGVAIDDVQHYLVYQCMLYKGYHYAMHGELKLQWLLKSISHG